MHETITVTLRPALRPLSVLLLGLALAGCERTAFESPPSDSSRCDKALVGQWLSQPGQGGQDGELVAIVADDCSLRVERPRADGTRRSSPTPLRSDRVAGERYLWLDARWAHDSFDVATNTLDRDGDVYLFAYAFVGRDGLRLHPIRHRALAHRVLDKDVPGELLVRDDSLTVRIPGDSDTVAALLRKYRLFDTGSSVDFRRAASTRP